MANHVRGGSDPKCILLTATNKAAKKPWAEAEALVSAGKARFISRTEFKAHVAGVAVPASVKKEGDRAVKDFIRQQPKSAK
jgi:hypothetical protein